MNNSILYYLSPVFIGLGATVTLDLWTFFLWQALNIKPSNFCLIGRWLLYMPEGTFSHSNIATVPRKRAECIMGWIAHYAIGVIFAAVFIAFAGRSWLQHPKLISAVAFAVFTVTMPFFIMQPAFGFGIASSKSSNPNQARLRSLMNHVAFGVGLYLFGLLLDWLT